MLTKKVTYDKDGTAIEDKTPGPTKHTVACSRWNRAVAGVTTANRIVSAVHENGRSWWRHAGDTK